MTQTIPARDFGHVYLYALPKGDAPDIAALLGVAELDLSQVDVIALQDLEDYGLRGYLTDGMGIPPEEIGPEIAALSGTVAVVRSPAFGGAQTPITLAPGVRHIATYRERQPEPADGVLESAAATEPAPAKKKAPSQAAMQGRIALYALLVLFALTLLMVWIA